MQPVVRVALVGFTPFERNHIEAGLLPGDGPGHRYGVTESLGACSLAVVNADDDAAVAQVVDQGRLLCCVMLGTTQRPGAAAQLPRPISLVPLLRVMDQLVDRAPPMSAAVQRVHDDWARLLGRSASAPKPKPEPEPEVKAPQSATAAIPLIQGRAPQTDQALGRPVASALKALVVDTDDETWQLLSTQLARWGCEAHRLRDCAQALGRLSKHPHALVFLATGLDGMDSFHTCKTIKRSTAVGSRQQTSVWMLLQNPSAVDRVRADMAGADGCLDKPLNLRHLEQTLTHALASAHCKWPSTHAPAAHTLNTSSHAD